MASLLQLRGSRPGASPLCASNGDVLCFNGEVFGGMAVPAGSNDAQCLLDALSPAAAHTQRAPAPAAHTRAAEVGPHRHHPCPQHGPQQQLQQSLRGTGGGAQEAPHGGQHTAWRGGQHGRQDPVPRVLSALRGPWTLLFWQEGRQRLWLGRDVLGRRSLLVHFPDAADPRLVMCSVSQLPEAAPAAATAADGVARPAAAAAPGAPTGSGAGPGVAGGAGGGAAEGAGEGAEEQEPSGSDGYWTELPPGLYSVDFGGNSDVGQVGCGDGGGTLSAGEPPGQGVGATAHGLSCGGEGVGAGSSEAEAEAEVVQETRLGGRMLVLVRHAWRDGALRALQRYQRAETRGSLLPPAQQDGQAQQERQQQQLQKGEALGVCGSAVGAATGTAPTQGDTGAAADVGSAGRCSGDQLLEPAVASLLRDIGPSDDAAALALMNVLLAAMWLRCGCLETRSPHPAAAYAAAARRPGGQGQGPAAQPSWRSPDGTAILARYSSSSTCGSSTTGSGALPLQGLEPHASTPAAPSAAVPGSGLLAPPAPCAPSPPPPTPTAPAAAPEVTAAAADAVLDDPAPVLILFSGGVDSVLLAALAHRVLPPHVPIDLSNVCFAGGASPDRLAARCALEELAAACPGRTWRLVEVDATLADVDAHKERLLALLRPAGTVMDLNIGAALWLAVAGQGALRLPRGGHGGQGGGQHGVQGRGQQGEAAPAAQSEERGEGDWPGEQRGGPEPAGQCGAPAGASSSVGVAGGAAEGGGRGSSGAGPGGSGSSGAGPGGSGSSGAGPEGSGGPADRGGSGGPADTGGSRRSSGGLVNDGALFGSAARVVLLGHGADEQCGGYGRHRTRFRSEGPAGLSAELEVDVRRLWLRNLGRDDRLAADWGREARHPFLDERVMELLLRMPLEQLLDMRLPPGEGDKRVIRAALRMLGLPKAASRVKRAIQFGSRIGKLANQRAFGSNRAANKASAGSVQLQDVSQAADKAASTAWVKPPKGTRGPRAGAPPPDRSG